MISALVVLCLAGGAALSLTMLLAASRYLLPDLRAGGVDPIVGPPDRIAVYRRSAPLIRPHPAVLVPMPGHLKTRHEMVTWMTQELPRAVIGARK